MPTLSIDDVSCRLARHLPLYRYRRPVYQTVMLNSLLSVWRERHERLLDVGGGTGVVAQCIADLFPVGSVTVVDVVDRFCTGLGVATRVYDGRTLPFVDGSFEAATLNNVLHHVPLTARGPLLAEIRRVTGGPLYIKDHEALGTLDHLRLSALDWIGNVPFSGMVEARYLSPDDWRGLAAESGYRIAQTARAGYRSGLPARLFPNRLETIMRWEPA